MIRLLKALPRWRFCRRAALAQDWPRQKADPHSPRRLRAHGKHHDLVARLVAPKLSEALGQSVGGGEQCGGAGAHVATLQVKAFRAGRYALLVTSASPLRESQPLRQRRLRSFTDFSPVDLRPQARRTSSP